MMDEKEVPEDFPSCEFLGSLAGVQPKLSLVHRGGRYYTLSNDPTTRSARYEICLDLIGQFVIVANKTKSGKRRDVPEGEILNQYRARLLASGWGIEQKEAIWIFEKVAERLGWPPPPPFRPEKI